MKTFLHAARVLPKEERLFLLFGACVSVAPLLALLPLSATLTLALLIVPLVWKSIHAPVRPFWTRLLMAALIGTIWFQYGGDIDSVGWSAILVGLVGLKISELKTTRDGRMLALTVLLCPMMAILNNQGPVTLVLAIGGLVAALTMSTYLVDRDFGVRRPWWQTMAPTLLLLAACMPVALTMYASLPRMQGQWWGAQRGASEASRTMGMSGEMRVGDMVDLLQDYSIAFSVEFHDGVPTGTPYWRGPVLWDYNGKVWKAWEDIEKKTPTPLERPPGARVLRYDVYQEPSFQRFAFALDLPITAHGRTRLGADRYPQASGPVNRVQRFLWSSMEGGQADRVLDPASRKRALAVPEDSNPETRALIEAWQGEGLEGEALINRAQTWLQDNTRYSLLAPALGTHAVDDFLFRTQQGFCEHYSSSFAIMMRMAGIPTRVVNGYAGGEQHPMGTEWVIRQSDAHAWVEVWLPEKGWVRHDPTSGLRTLGNIQRRTPNPALDAWEWVRMKWHKWLLDEQQGQQRQIWTWVGSAILSRILLAILATGLTLGFGFGMWRLWSQWRLGRTDPLSAAWHRWEKALKKAGLTRDVWEDEARLLQRMPPAWPEELKATLRRAIAFYQATRYGRPGSVTQEALVFLQRPPRFPKREKEKKSRRAQPVL